MSELSIRPARRTDVDAVYEFLCELEAESIDKDRFEFVYEQNMANSQVHYLVADRAGEVVGFVSCHVQYLLHHAGRVGEIQELFIRADCRNQQIGHKFVHTLEAIAVREGLISLEVTTNRKRPDAIRFYKQLQFQQSHVKLVRRI